MSYTQWDVQDGHGPDADVEALETQRLDADLEQAQMEARGDAIHRAQQAGVCTHGSAVGYRAEPCYPEQVGLEPGQSRCTAGCGRVFGSDEDWLAAIDAAIAGY